MLVSLLHAWLSISIRADQIISGTIINILAFGLTGYLNRLLISPNPRLGAGIFQPLRAARLASSTCRSSAGSSRRSSPMARSRSRSCSSSIFLQIWLFRSRWGLRTRAVGEHPKAAETVGIDVIRLRYRNVILGGVFAGLAGAYLTLETERVVPERDDQRTRLHRPGRGHLRPLDAARGVRRRAPVHRIGGAAGGDQPDSADRPAGRRDPVHPSRVLWSPALLRHPRRPGRRRSVGASPPAAVGKPYVREAGPETGR